MNGLTREEVERRIMLGQVNQDENPGTRSVRQIVRDNSLTFFNFLNIVLFAMVILVGSFRNALFIGNVFFNTAIGIVQELRAKRILDRLSILAQAKATVIRDGIKEAIPTQELVMDDVILLRSGDQVPADARIIEGALEVNEALLTGEADALAKSVGEELYSGSFITAGEAWCRVNRVGAQSYAAHITKEAKTYTRHHSELRRSLDLILKCVGVIIIPIGVLLFYKSYVLSGDGLRQSVVGTVAGVLGMIPEGLILLTSVTLTVGAVLLARKRTLVQELFCIETLARVDTLCLDKTGTITTGTMQVERTVPYTAPLLLPEAVEEMADDELLEVLGAIEGLERPDTYSMQIAMVSGLDTTPGFLEAASQQAGMPEEEPVKEAERILANLMAVLKDDNPTARALREAYPPRTDMEPEQTIPFSSERKYSGASFKKEGTFLIGAVQFLFPEEYPGLKQQCEAYAKEGLRVLVLAKSPEVLKERSSAGSAAEKTGKRKDRRKNRNTQQALPGALEPVALVLISDVIRPEAPETISYFYEQGVDLKVISGDDPQTVAAVAEKAGVNRASRYVDASALKTEEEIAEAVENYTVFGRVTPQQKRQMVKALKDRGHIVAMTGDGVNDVLALKESNCSIAMAQGSDAAKNSSNIVLLDSDFSALPNAVNQGRRVIHNIRSAASMFLIKTVFSLILALVTIFWGNTYPFEPIQMTLIGACAVGIPTYILSQEPNYQRIETGFLRHVFRTAIPTGVTIAGCVTVLMAVCNTFYDSTAQLGTACFLVTGWNYMAALRTVYYPLNIFRTIVIYGMQVVFFGSALLLQKLLNLEALEFGMIILVFILMTFSPLVSRAVHGWLYKMYRRSLQKNESILRHFRLWLHRRGIHDDDEKPAEQEADQ